MIKLKITGAAAVLVISSVASTPLAFAQYTGEYAAHRSAHTRRANCGPANGGAYFASGVVPGAWGTPYNPTIYPNDYGSTAYYARCGSGSQMR